MTAALLASLALGLLVGWLVYETLVMVDFATKGGE
jgi:hypothetical protein